MGCIYTKHELNKPDLDFLIENTEFSKQQIETWYNGFIADCPSGELTKAKFIEVYQQLFPNGDASKFCGHIFRTFDTDNSGKIDFKEFLLAINITAKGNPEKKLKWAFQMYDVNGDGSIDLEEMLQIIQSISDLLGLNDGINRQKGIPNENIVCRTDQIFSKMDTDKNGVISESEFINGCLQDKFLYQMLTADYSSEL